MALETIKNNFGQGGSLLSGTGPGMLKNILKELQGLSFGIYTGVGAGSDITITGMAAEDTVIAVLDITTPANLLTTNFTPKANALTSVAATTGKNLIVVWANKQ